MRKTVGKLLAVTFVMLGAIVLASPVEVLAKKKVKTEKVTIIKGRNQCFTFRKLKLKKIKVKYSKKRIAKAKLKKDVNLGAYIQIDGKKLGQTTVTVKAYLANKKRKTFKYKVKVTNYLQIANSKAAKKKKKEEAETAKAKEDVKSRKMDDYDDEKSSDDEDDDEYEYVDEYPRFRPGRIILGIISLLAFGFCIYKGFVTGLSTSGADVTSAPGMNYVIVALCMLVTALLYFIMNNRDTLFAFLIPMIVYIGSAVFAFLKHGDEFELLILAGVSGVLAVISLILAIASRGGDDYDDEDDYDDPFEEEHDN